MKLDCNAISKMTKSVQEEFIVQIIEPKTMKTADRITCFISDGYYKIRCYISHKNYGITQEDANAIIKVKNYAIIDQNGKIYAILIHQCIKLDMYMEQIGKPIQLPKQPQQYPKDTAYEIDETKLKSYIRKKEQRERAEENQNKREEQLSDVSIIPLKQVKDINLEENEKIADLDPELPTSQLGVKLIKKNYKQFISKQGKQTKVLNLQFMDHTGTIICAAMFGDNAINFYKTLKQNRLYLISRGKVREDHYAPNKSKNHSRYSILLTSDTQLKLINNQDIVIETSNKINSLKELINQGQYFEKIDSVGILLAIQPEIQFEKAGQSKCKQSIEICDPINKTIIEVIIWQKKCPVSTSMLNKTIELTNFRLNTFNSRVALSSTYTSSLKLLDDHPFSQFQGKINKNQMELLSVINSKRYENEQPCRNLKELDQQIEYIQQGDQIRSSLNLYLTVINSKSWCYQSCPNCRKSAEKSNKCNYCGKVVLQTVPRYKINIEMSDCTGSIWATGFEEFGTKLFEQIPGGIQYLKSLDENRRQQIFESQTYKQFAVKITSKLDDFSKIKHTITKIMPMELMPNLLNDIKRIKKHLTCNDYQLIQ